MTGEKKSVVHMMKGGSSRRKEDGGVKTAEYLQDQMDDWIEKSC